MGAERIVEYNPFLNKKIPMVIGFELLSTHTVRKMDILASCSPFRCQYLVEALQ